MSITSLRSATVDLNEAPSTGRGSRGHLRRLYVLLPGFVGLAVWQLASGRLVDPFWISSPFAVASQLYEWAVTGLLWVHLSQTLQEAVIGFVLGNVLGAVIGILLGLNRTLSDMIEPYIMGFFSIPIIVFAPLFLLAFGIGIMSKVAFATVLVFFIVFFQTFTGIRTMDASLMVACRLMGANELQLITKVVLPSVAVWILSGIRLSVRYALMGAIVAEFVASARGIGYLVTYYSANYSVTASYAAISVIAVVAITANYALGRLERYILRWR